MSEIPENLRQHFFQNSKARVEDGSLLKPLPSPTTKHHMAAGLSVLVSAAFGLGSCGGGDGDNRPPEAVASASRTDVGEGIEVELSAAASSDPDGDPVSFSWRQTEGPPVALSDPAAPAPTFIAPPVGPAGSALAFEVNATDGTASSIASVVIQAHPLNFLVILTDDQTVASAAFMPTLQERIVGEGVWFDNAFATSPLCCPSRSSFFSGRYTHNHGVLTNSEPRGGATHFDDAQTIAVWLEDAGYRTGLFGKYLNDYDAVVPHVPSGWDRWIVLFQDNDAFSKYDYDVLDDGVIRHYGDAPEDYSTDVVTGKALEFLDEVGEQPFMVWFTPRAPHRDYVPAPRHLGLLENEALPKPPNYYEADVSDKPAWVQALPSEPAPELESDYPRYLETLLAIDEALGLFMDRLEDMGVLDRTVIIFASDNGFSWGEHRWNGKRAPYEEDVRIPLAIRYPPSTAPAQVESVVLNIDIAPTIAELAGVELSAPVDGVSHAAALRDGAWSTARTDFLIENFGSEGEDAPEHFAVRTPEWKYVEFMSGEVELYDLLNDPFELDNVVDQPAHSDVRTELESQLQELRAAGTDTLPLRVMTPQSIALPPGEDMYIVALTASGGAGPYLWKSAPAAPLPPGSSLGEDGVLTVPAVAFLDGGGAPTQVLTIGVRVEDQTESWDCARIQLSIE